MASVPVEVAGNLLILAAVLLGPFLSHRLERNLEAFLFVMGMAAVLVSRMLSVPLVAEALPHPIPITLAVVASLGLLSSVITAIIAALLLVELIAVLRLQRRDEVRLVVLSCFAIGLGASLTPVGEPLSTIATAKLGQDFWFLFRLLGPGGSSRWRRRSCGPPGRARRPAWPRSSPWRSSRTRACSSALPASTWS